MLDDHVVVGELILPGEIQAVQNAFEAFPGELGPDVVAREFCARRERMQVHPACPAELPLHRRDVIRIGRFVLKLYHLHHRAVAHHQLGDCVGQIWPGRAPEVTLNHR